MGSLDFYQQYWKHFYGWSPSNVLLSSFEKAFIRSHLHPNYYVIDCGVGDCSHYSDVVLSSGAHYIGLDISKTALHRCRAKGFNVLIHDLNSSIPFSDNLFDVAICFEVLEHLFDPENALKEINRVLKPKGKALITVPNIVFLPNRLLFLAGIFNPSGSPATSLRFPWRDPHIRFFTKNSLSKLLRKTNFLINNFTGYFSIAHFPVIYRLKRMRRIAEAISSPIMPIGHYWPSLFTHRFFVVAEKPQ